MENKRIDLRLDCGYGGPLSHPQQYMRALGITYKLAVPQSIADQWWFFACENVPEKLPECLSIMENKNLKGLVGYGLSMQDVAMLEGNLPEPPPKAPLVPGVYRNQREVDLIRKDCDEAGLVIQEHEYHAVDKLIWDMKEGGLYSKMECMYAPPFLIKGTASEPTKGINLVRLL